MSNVVDLIKSGKLKVKPNLNLKDVLDNGNCIVSTVQLVIPIDSAKFETRIFGGKFNNSYWLYENESDARNGHAEIINTLSGETKEAM